MKEFEVTLKLRNNLLKKRRLELGLKPREIAEKIGISYPLYLKFEGLKQSPLNKKGEWTPSAQKIADFFKQGFEVLWPDVVLAVKNAEVVAEVSAARVMALAEMTTTPQLAASPEEAFTTVDQTRLVFDMDEALKQLPPREERILRDYYGLNKKEETKSLKEIGKDYDRSVERMRNLKDQALSHLRRVASDDQWETFSTAVDDIAHM